MLLSSFDVAIIVCTYNPEEVVFSRTLNAIAALEIPAGLSVECVIVDNNSSTPIAQLPYVQSFLQQCPWATVVQESRQGLTFARLRGIESTTGEIVVFIDDDNEPTANYLYGVQHCFATYASVAVWGPGKVTVEFLAPVSDWFKQTFRGKFQHKDVHHTQYGCVMEQWTDFYPPGTGMCVRRVIVERYCQAVEAGILAATDRQGRSLSSGGDVQIVWEAIKMGLAAGISPKLQMTHLIPERRATIDYVARLSFGTASSYMPIASASFGWDKEKVAQSKPSDRAIAQTLFGLVLRRSFKFKFNLLRVELAKSVGQIVGVLRVIDSSDRHWIYRVVKIMGFE